MMPGLPQSASQPGFATFLANIGQTPASGTGEDGGFGQLLATHPGAATIGKTGTAGAAPTGKTGTPGAAPTGDTQATTASVIALAGPKAAGTVAPTADAVPTTAITPDETPHVVTPDFAAIVGGKKLATEAKAAPPARTSRNPMRRMPRHMPPACSPR